LGAKLSRRLQRVFNVEFEQDLINEIWKPYTVEYTGLKSDSLFIFQIYFQPEYLFFHNASHYEKLAYISKAMRLYIDSMTMIHETIHLPKINLK